MRFVSGGSDFPGRYLAFIGQGHASLFFNRLYEVRHRAPIITLRAKTKSVAEATGSQGLACQTRCWRQVRFLERTKTRVGSMGKLGPGKLHKWRTCKANGALPEDGTEDVCSFQ